jgi:integrase
MVRFHRRSVLATPAASPTLLPCAFATRLALARADLRPLRFHDLRHTFGTLAVGKAEVPAVQAWMGRSHIGTTMRYIDHRDRGDETRLLAEAFRARPDPVESLDRPGG